MSVTLRRRRPSGSGEVDDTCVVGQLPDGGSMSAAAHDAQPQNRLEASALRLGGISAQRHKSIQPHAKNRLSSFPFERDRALALFARAPHTQHRRHQAHPSHLQGRPAASSAAAPRRPDCGSTSLGFAWLLDKKSPRFAPPRYVAGSFVWGGRPANRYGATRSLRPLTFVIAKLNTCRPPKDTVLPLP